MLYYSVISTAFYGHFSSACFAFKKHVTFTCRFQSKSAHTFETLENVEDLLDVRSVENFVRAREKLAGEDWGHV